MAGLKRKRDVMIKSGVIDDLPESILTEILIRLPVKYAHRCKSVCKRWNFLISDPYFATQFTRHHNSHSSSSSSSSPPSLQSLILQYTETFKSRECLLSFLPCFLPGNEPCVVGSSRGLLLCHSTLCYSYHYYVCNPVTMNWVNLPSPPQVYQLSQSHTGFISDEEEEEREEGINYRFTVVRIPAVRQFNSNTFRMEIFSSETGEWSETDVPSPARFLTGLDFPLMRAVFCEGILYFLNPQGSIFAYNPYHNGTDTDDQFRFIDMPAYFHYRLDLRLGTSQGRLRLFQMPLMPLTGGKLSYLIVWELKDCNTSNWCLEHKVCVQKLLSDSHVFIDRLWGCIESYPRVLAFDSNDCDVIYMWYNSSNASTFFLCNMRHMTIKEISGPPSLPFGLAMVFPLLLPCWPTPVPELPPHKPLPELPKNALPY